MKKRFFSVCTGILSLLLLGAAFFFFWRSTQGTPSSADLPALTRPPVFTPSLTPVPAPTGVPSTVPPSALPRDRLFITAQRQQYGDGDLRLIIPKLGVDVPVLNGVDADTLLNGVGLYDYAQLPSEEDGNVSIAGHRNGLKNGKITDNMPFYYLDTLEKGDALYLQDHETIYQYAFDVQTVVEPDDWGPIYNQGFACLTLTTCTPIGISDHRLIIRGQLFTTIPHSQDYDFPAAVEETETP